jgi:hypothetical protein
MEVHINNHSFDINNNLLKENKAYRFNSKNINIRGQKKYIGSLYDDDDIILRVDYLIFGSFSKDKNVWIWSNMSEITDNYTKEYISNIRSYILNNITKKYDKDTIIKLKKFSSNDYSVITTIKLCEYLGYISEIISNITNNNIFLTIERNNNIDILFINKIIFNNFN